MPTTPHDIFISHSSKDKQTADAICALLEHEGIRCWMAPRDVFPGEEWAQAIIRGINGSRVFVLLFSNFSNQSAQVRREVERAANREIPIIPFRLENIEPNETLEYFISSPHWLDAFDAPLEQHIRRLADGIAHLLRAAPPQTLPEPHAPTGPPHSAEPLAPAAPVINPSSPRTPTTIATPAPSESSQPPPLAPERTTPAAGQRASPAPRIALFALLGLGLLGAAVYLLFLLGLRL